MSSKIDYLWSKNSWRSSQRRIASSRERLSLTWHKAFSSKSFKRQLTAKTKVLVAIWKQVNQLKEWRLQPWNLRLPRLRPQAQQLLRNRKRKRILSKSHHRATMTQRKKMEKNKPKIVTELQIPSYLRLRKSSTLQVTISPLRYPSKKLTKSSRKPRSRKR